MIARVVILCLMLVPATAWSQQTGPVGEWFNQQNDPDARIASSLDIRADGTSSVEIDGQFSAAFLADSDQDNVQQMADLFPEGLRIQISGEGTWTATPDSITLDFPDPQVLINGGTFEQFILAIATSLAGDVVEQLNLPPEQEPAVVATFTDLLSEELSESDVTDQAFASEGTPTAYRVEGGVLVLVDADGTEARWLPRSASAVGEASWAQVKRAISVR